jgi:hypothetical protein
MRPAIQGICVPGYRGDNYLRQCSDSAGHNQGWQIWPLRVAFECFICIYHRDKVWGPSDNSFLLY